MFHRGIWAQAIVTVATILVFQRLTKVGQQDATATGAAFSISYDLLKLLAGDALFLLVWFLRDQILNFGSITVAKKDDTLRGLPVSSCTARILAISLKAPPPLVFIYTTHTLL